MATRFELIEMCKIEADKRDESVVGAALVSSWALVLVVLNWHSVRCVMPEDDSAEVLLGGLADYWEAAWDGCVIDFEQISIILDLDMNEAIEAVTRAQELRMIYPNNAVDKNAIDIARRLVKATLPKFEERDDA